MKFRQVWSHCRRAIIHFLQSTKYQATIYSSDITSIETDINVSYQRWLSLFLSHSGQQVLSNKKVERKMLLGYKGIKIVQEAAIDQWIRLGLASFISCGPGFESQHTIYALCQINLIDTIVCLLNLTLKCRIEEVIVNWPWLAILEK